MKNRNAGEDWTKQSGPDGKTRVQPVGDDCVGDEAATQRVEREQRGKPGQRTKRAENRLRRGAFHPARHEQGKKRGDHADRRIEKEEGAGAAEEGGRQTARRVEQAAGQRVAAKRSIARLGLHRLREHGLLHRGKGAVVDAGCAQHAGQTRDHQQARLPGEGEVDARQRHQQPDPGEGHAPPDPPGDGGCRQTGQRCGREADGQRQADQRGREAGQFEVKGDQHRREPESESPQPAG